MKNILILSMLVVFSLLGQNLPVSWSQSYCTYDLAETHDIGQYSLGFGIDNYCIFSRVGDTTAFDERRFDIFAKLGVLKNAELEVKYSYPTAGVVAVKYRFYENFLHAALKFGIGYMKGTRTGYITDYVFDFYPTLIFSKNMYRKINIYFAPKLIYSIHPRDRQEHSLREPTHIFHYGFGLGMAFGDRFRILPEINWLYGSVNEADYIISQFGIGLDLLIN
ncbi:MAG: hypothetical protein WBE28_08925 [bacterium]